MRVFKNRRFGKFARKSSISDSDLFAAVERANLGLIDADLGGGVIKQRIARSGQGKSGGFRTLLLFRAKQRAIFFYGFAKKDRENVSDEELWAARKAAKFFLSRSESEIDAVVATGEFVELKRDEKTLS